MPLYCFLALKYPFKNIDKCGIFHGTETAPLYTTEMVLGHYD